MGSSREASSELAALAARTGVGPPGSDEGEHWRWWVYSSAVEDPTTWSALLRLVSEEPDPHVAESVVLLMVERVDPTTATEWVDLLPAEHQGFPRARLRDVVLRDHVLAGGHVAVDEVPGWTRWLQREVAGSAESHEVLSVLEASGATRRIRGLARERMIALRRRDRGR
ncbi:MULTISPECIES: hypothetical protein [Cellulosimicrobium]|uniref:hypothetical protein n=1 Tax=Cellulosimicrobium TaxID=157920 RepID=UPI002809CB3F|nr:hypothetical protein [Cellulosimicrobium sp. XJ-DQ-B-000]MDQ8040845.1 hypothetical protein [Cellulosimicrobium sp. XJ-DQ-B-000]